MRQRLLFHIRHAKDTLNRVTEGLVVNTASIWLSVIFGQLRNILGTQVSGLEESIRTACYELTISNHATSERVHVFEEVVNTNAKFVAGN